MHSRVEYAKLVIVQEIDAHQVQVTSGSSLHVVNLREKSVHVVVLTWRKYRVRTQSELMRADKSQ